MIALEPIAHDPPLKPIEFRPVWTHEPEEPLTICQAITQAVQAADAKTEADRIWKLVVSAAEACGSAPAPVVESMPVVDAVYPAPAVADEDDWVDTAPSELCYWAPESDAG